MTAQVKELYMGIDPSSRKIAAVVLDTHGTVLEILTSVMIKNAAIEERCRYAIDWCNEYVMGWYHVRVEAPVFVGQKGGLKALIPQAKVHGALVGASRGVSSLSVGDAVVPTWKKVVVGKGNASKTDVAEWVKKNYPTFYEDYSDDQDLMDALCVARYCLWQETGYNKQV